MSGVQVVAVLALVVVGSQGDTVGHFGWKFGWICPGSSQAQIQILAPVQLQIQLQLPLVNTSPGDSLHNNV